MRSSLVATDEIIERIRKLLRLSEDAGATEAEAAAALERANALLIRHNLTLEAIAVGVGAGVTTVVEEQVRTGWSGQLARFPARRVGSSQPVRGYPAPPGPSRLGRHCGTARECRGHPRHV